MNIKKGAKDCLTIENKKNAEDIQEWKNEINAIETIVNNYLKEKARADKLEEDYSKALTKIDEL